MELFLSTSFRFCCKGSALGVSIEEMIEDKIDNAKVESLFDPLDFKALKEVFNIAAKLLVACSFSNKFQFFDIKYFGGAGFIEKNKRNFCLFSSKVLHLS